MYVWKNKSRRDRRRSGRRPPESCEERVETISTKDIKTLLESYLDTDHGRLEVLAVADNLKMNTTNGHPSAASVREQFNFLDKDGNGSIDVTELETLLRELGFSCEGDAERIAEELDADKSGTIDFDEFFRWTQNTKLNGGGINRIIQAKGTIVACAVYDAQNLARLAQRQNQGLGRESIDDEDAAAAEKKFRCVRAVLGEPGKDPLEGDYDVRGFRARRLLYHQDLWPLPPPEPSVLPPPSMNATSPRLADTTKKQFYGENAKIQGFDPTRGERAAHRCIRGLDVLGSANFFTKSSDDESSRNVSSLATALIALRRDIDLPRQPSEKSSYNMPNPPAVEVVPSGCKYARVVFWWRPNLQPRPDKEVAIESDFTEWKPRKLVRSRQRREYFEVSFDLAPGIYRYRFRVDSDASTSLDTYAPTDKDGHNVVYVFEDHHRQWANLDGGFNSGQPFRIALSGTALRDDGAWALAAAVRAGGGGGGLVSMDLGSTGMSSDGVCALGSALASGAARALETLDLSHNRLGADGGAALGKMLQSSEMILKKLVLRGCCFADEGTARLARGIAGHAKLETLDMSQNDAGELGATALSRALVHNGKLKYLSLAGNRLDVASAHALAVPIRISGSLTSLDLADNPALGPEGTAVLGDALAGGSHELVARLERKRDGALVEPSLAFYDLAEEESASARKARLASERHQETFAHRAAKLAARRAVLPKGISMRRSGTLKHLGLARCGVGKLEMKTGIFALTRGISRRGPLTSLDLTENELNDWSASELARTLAETRCGVIEVKLDGNPIRPEWMWQNHFMNACEEDEGSSRKGGSKKRLLPSIATSLEANRRQLEFGEREGGKKVAGAFRMKLLVDPATNSCSETNGRLEGEWTAARGWYPRSEKRDAESRRNEAMMRAAELARGRAEKDAVEAAGVAGAAIAANGARRIPEGPRFVTAIARELARKFDVPPGRHSTTPKALAKQGLNKNSSPCDPPPRRALGQIACKGLA